ncbi:unnamed protein product [Prorocentrum cordatum]|uniref:Uncharacterized protein n=1 Tax=Prorocentrum cordatum TaxID=2364126 RepID=A0ABN9VFP0_9DINO|nr:unnamed protein product [Polarella glacialis]
MAPQAGFSFNAWVRNDSPSVSPGGSWTPVLGRRRKKEPYTFCKCGHWTYDRLLRKRGHCVGCMAELVPASDSAKTGEAHSAWGGGGVSKPSGLAAPQLAFMQKLASDLPPDKAAEGKQRATANRLQQALQNQVRIQKMLAEAERKVDDALLEDIKAKQEVEEAARRLAQRVLPPEEPSAKESVVHIEALLTDPSSLSLDLGEEPDLSGDLYSDEERKQLAEFSKGCAERARVLLSTAFSQARDEAQKIKKERSERFEQLKKKRIARAAVRQELEEAARKGAVGAKGNGMQES